MSAPKTPTTRPGLLDVPVKRKTKKSAFLRKLEREQAAAKAEEAIVQASRISRRKARVAQLSEAYKVRRS